MLNFETRCSLIKFHFSSNLPPVKLLSQRVDTFAVLGVLTILSPAIASLALASAAVAKASMLVVSMVSNKTLVSGRSSGVVCQFYDVVQEQTLD
jgi:hypothetical protein